MSVRCLVWQVLRSALVLLIKLIDSAGDGGVLAHRIIPTCIRKALAKWGD